MPEPAVKCRRGRSIKTVATATKYRSVRANNTIFYFVGTGLREIHVYMDKYTAFISYRHKPLDIKIASEIQKGLETFTIPHSVQKETGRKRIGRVFRDKEELTVSSNLSEDIVNALQESEYLVVICSPNTRESNWVTREIQEFLKTHDKKKVLIVLAGGEPEQVIPEVLFLQNETDDIYEPLCCDYRGTRKENQKVELPRLVAAILGCGYDRLINRMHQYMMKRVMIISAICIGVLSAFLTLMIRNYFTIKDKNTAILESESKALSLTSESVLKEKNRFLSIKYAIQALTSENESRPYVPEGEKALSDALRVYRSPYNSDFISKYVFNSSNPVTRVDMTKDGKYICILDNVGTIHVIETSTGTVRWEEEGCIATHDFYINNNSGTIIFFKSNEYYTSDHILYNNIDIVVKEIENGNQLVSINTVYDVRADNHVSLSDINNYLCFNGEIYDLNTGEIIETFPATGFINIGESYCISPDGSYYAYALENRIYLCKTGSGEPAVEYTFPPSSLSLYGIFLSFVGEDELLAIRRLKNAASEASTFTSYCLLSGNRGQFVFKQDIYEDMISIIMDTFLYEDKIVTVQQNGIVILNKSDGTPRLRLSVTNILSSYHCDNKLWFVKYDGDIEQLDLDTDFNNLTLETKNIEDGRLLDADISSDYCCYIKADDEKSLYVCGSQYDTNCICLNRSSALEVDARQIVRSGNGETFAYIYAKKKGDKKYITHIDIYDSNDFNIVYSSDSDLKWKSEFFSDNPYNMVADLVANDTLSFVSENYSNRVFNINTQNLENLVYGQFDIKSKAEVIFDNHVLMVAGTNYALDGILKYFPEEGKTIVAQVANDNEYDFDTDLSIEVGENGYSGITCKKENDYYIAASFGYEDTMTIIPVAVHPSQLFAFADKKPLACFVDTDGNLTIYDLKNQKSLRIIPISPDLPVERIYSIDFCNDDTVILLQTDGGNIILISKDSGEVLGTYNAEILRGYSKTYMITRYAEMLTTDVDPISNSLYIYEKNGEMTGLKIDLDSFGIQAEIPYMIGFLPCSHRILTLEAELTGYDSEMPCKKGQLSLNAFPAYTTDDLINYGKDIIKDYE